MVTERDGCTGSGNSDSIIVILFDALTDAVRIGFLLSTNGRHLHKDNRMIMQAS